METLIKNLTNPYNVEVYQDTRENPPFRLVKPIFIKIRLIDLHYPSKIIFNQCRMDMLGY